MSLDYDYQWPSSLGLYLCKSAANNSNDGKPCSLSDGRDHASDLALIADHKGT